MTTTPTNGVDRCPCGCKYWELVMTGGSGVWRCYDCNGRFDPTDAHTEHCCSDHGCCYNDSDCPVVLGDKPQSYPCEVCAYFNDEMDNYLKVATDEALLTELERRGFDTRGLDRW